MTVATQGFGKGISHATGMLKGFQGEIQKTSGLLSGVFVATGLAAATAGIYKLVKAGSDLIENQNKVKAVFGANADVVLQASEDMAAAFGTSRSEFQDAAGVFGAIFKNLGYDSDATAQLSIQMVKLAGDLASFKNISFDEALLKIRAGISGESEPLKAIGVLISEDATKLEAYRMKIAQYGKELTEQQKVQARLSLLTKQTADAQGDLAKTADDVANATRGFTGRIQNLAETIGATLQPVAKAVLGELSTAVTVAQLAWNDYSGRVVDASKETIQAVGQQVSSIGVLQRSIGFIADMWQTVKIGFAVAQSYITAGLGKIVSAISAAIQGLEDAINALGRAVSLASAGTVQMEKADFSKARRPLDEYAKDLKDLSEKQYGKFQDKLREPLPSEAVDQYFAHAKSEVKGLREELGKTGIDPNQFKPKAGQVKPTEIKFAHAETRGSSGAVNTILRSKFGGGHTNKENQKIVDNTKKSADNLEKLVAQGALMTIGMNVISNF